MKPLKKFEEYLEKGIAKKTTPDKHRAKSLIKEAERKAKSLDKKTAKLGIDDENANDYVEYCYDIIMHLARAKMYVEGYSTSGTGAHEAEVSFLRKTGMEEKDVIFLNQLRYFRNGILYYGTALDKEYAEKVIGFTKKKYSELKKALDKTSL